MKSTHIYDMNTDSHLLGNLTTELIKIGSGLGDLLSRTNHVHCALQGTTPSESHTIHYK